jgi:hypothetical protein
VWCKQVPFVSNLLKTAPRQRLFRVELDALDFKVIFQQFFTFLAEIPLAWVNFFADFALHDVAKRV